MDDSAVQTTRGTYDKIAQTYRRVNGEPYSALVAQIETFRARLPPGAMVADVGCGPGRDVTLLRTAGLRAIGFDLSAGMLRAGNLADVVLADMRALPIRTDAFAGIWSHAALLHLPCAQMPVALAEFARVLQRGGALHLAVAEGDGEGFESDLYDGEPRWFTRHRESSLIAVLEQVGFQVDSVDRASLYRDWLILGGTRTA